MMAGNVTNCLRAAGDNFRVRCIATMTAKPLFTDDACFSQTKMLGLIIHDPDAFGAAAIPSAIGCTKEVLRGVDAMLPLALFARSLLRPGKDERWRRY